MIIFHEGLPRSGKSYEAMCTRIIPAIKAGRGVVAYVEGINQEQIAELAGVTVERCRELLRALTREELQTVQADKQSGKVAKVIDHIPTLAQDNALIVLDEAQNFWGNRTKLGDEMTQFIAEHGHRGIDIVLMGQDLRDVHAVWRRRVELKLRFLKLNGLSLPDWAKRFAGKLAKPSYSVTTFRHLGSDQFAKVGVTITAYDPKYFGTYKSFVSDDTNTAAYTDQRAQVWSHPLIKYAIPAMAGLAVWGGFTAWAFFHPKPKDTPADVSAKVSEKQPAQVTAPQARTAPAPAASAPYVDQRSPIERRMTELSSKGRIRLAGLAQMGDRTSGIVEWVQGGSTVVERLTLDALRTLGVAVAISGDVVILQAGEYRDLATPWPLEDLGRVSESRQAMIRGPQQMAAAAVMPDDMANRQAPPQFRDLPGTLTTEGTTGSVIRRTATGR